MLIPNPEKTSEKEELEGHGTMGNSSLMRRKTVYEMSSVYYQGWGSAQPGTGRRRWDCFSQSTEVMRQTWVHLKWEG